jgi:hypothetical protein
MGTTDLAGSTALIKQNAAAITYLASDDASFVHGWIFDGGRQFGGVFGAPILVVVLGKAQATGDPSRFYELWRVAVALCAAAVAVSLGLTPRRQPAKADVTVPAAAAATDSTGSSVA